MVSRLGYSLGTPSKPPTSLPPPPPHAKTPPRQREILIQGIELYFYFNY